MFCKLFISLYHRQSSDIESDEDWEPVSKSPILRDTMTAPHQERSPAPHLPREVLPAEDQGSEDGGEGEGELAAAAVKLRCQPAHLKRDGMVLMFQT